MAGEGQFAGAVRVGGTVEGQAEEYGVLFDALGCCDLAGYSASVLLSNYFLLPATLEELLRLPRETFDAPEEVFEAGWRVD